MSIINVLKNKLINLIHQKNYSNEEIKQITKAIEFAELKHQNQFRKSKEPYIIHPISTAIFLVEWNMDVNTIISGLFHDLLEDTQTTEQEITENFNSEILYLVKSVTKVSNLSKTHRDTILKNEIESDYIVDLILSMSLDIRGMIIKLADRLHNMETIQFLPEEKQKRIATETLNIFANIAGRIGMYYVKTRLLDTCFFVLHKEEYLSTKQKIDEVIKNNDSNWKSIKKKIQELITSYGIEFCIEERYKGIYSTYQKLLTKSNIQDIRDIYAIRIITKNVMDCYLILGIIHTNFKYLPKALYDFISLPKLNLYQSIHTTIYNESVSKLLEVQIRTSKMNDYANFGLASHWKYKENNKSETKQEINNTIQYIIMNEILQNNIYNKETKELKLISNDNIIEVLINNKKMMIVNKNSSLLDIAFQYNKEMFFKLDSVSVNGVFVKFSSKVDKNDNIFFSYNEYNNFDRKWLTWANMNSTKEYIQKEINNQDSEKIKSSNNYIYLLRKKLKENWIGLKETERILKEDWNFKDISEFLDYCKQTNKDINLISKVFSKVKKESNEARKKTALFVSDWLIYKNYLIIDTPLLIKKINFSDCCNQISGENIIGVLNKDILNIHNEKCVNKKHNFKNSKILSIKWNKDKIEKDKKTFPYKLSLKSFWSPNIGTSVSEILMNYNIDLVRLEVIRKGHKSCIIELLIYSSDISEIKKFYSHLAEIDFILENNRG